MDENPAKTQEVSRRSVLVGAVSGLSSVWLATHLPVILAAKVHADTTVAAGGSANFAFFSPDQAIEIEAVAAQIIPKDDTPGAREVGIIYFIDRVLTTFEQDKQAVYTRGLKELRAKTQELFSNIDKFSDLNSAQQVQVLTAMDKTPFFLQVRLHTIVGFFANPEYAGNRDKTGWNLIGFEDKFDWQPPFGSYDRDAHRQR
jgi:gluconate 2-dehydrogenase gamma chain